MDKIFWPKSPKGQKPDGLLSSLQRLGTILKWLKSLIQLTKDEQNDAGIYLKNQSIE